MSAEVARNGEGTKVGKEEDSNSKPKELVSNGQEKGMDLKAADKPPTAESLIGQKESITETKETANEKSMEKGKDGDGAGGHGDLQKDERQTEDAAVKNHADANGQSTSESTTKSEESAQTPDEQNGVHVASEQSMIKTEVETQPRQDKEATLSDDIGKVARSADKDDFEKELNKDEPTSTESSHGQSKNAKVEVDDDAKQAPVTERRSMSEPKIESEQKLGDERVDDEGLTVEAGPDTRNDVGSVPLAEQIKEKETKQIEKEDETEQAPVEDKTLNADIKTEVKDIADRQVIGAVHSTTDNPEIITDYEEPQGENVEGKNKSKSQKEDDLEQAPVAAKAPSPDPITDSKLMEEVRSTSKTTDDRSVTLKDDEVTPKEKTEDVKEQAGDLNTENKQPTDILKLDGSGQTIDKPETKDKEKSQGERVEEKQTSETEREDDSTQISSAKNVEKADVVEDEDKVTEDSQKTEEDTTHGENVQKTEIINIAKKDDTVQVPVTGGKSTTDPHTESETRTDDNQEVAGEITEDVPETKEEEETVEREKIEEKEKEGDDNRVEEVEKEVDDTTPSVETTNYDNREEESQPSHKPFFFGAILVGLMLVGYSLFSSKHD